jgi:hypothetical protein
MWAVVNATLFWIFSKKPNNRVDYLQKNNSFLSIFTTQIREIPGNQIKTPIFDRISKRFINLIHFTGKPHSS